MAHRFHRLKRLPIICMSLVCLTMLARPVAAQTPSVLVLDAHNAPLTTLVDGNSISLKISLSQAVSASTPVDFLLDGLDASIAVCTIPAGQSSCQTALFPTLGWAWDAAGVRQTERVVQAASAGLARGESRPLAIRRRHVFILKPRLFYRSFNLLKMRNGNG
jgi:hypothetical protein